MTDSRTIACRGSLLFKLCTIYFLYIEPVAALSGVYACFFEPLRFLTATISPTHAVSSLVERAILVQLGGAYALFATMGALILRRTQDRDIWRSVVLGCAVCDLGHIYGAAMGQGWEVALSCWLWTPEDWLNFGSLYVGLGLRLLFLIAS